MYYDLAYEYNRDVKRVTQGTVFMQHTGLFLALPRGCVGTRSAARAVQGSHVPATAKVNFKTGSILSLDPAAVTW